MRPGLNVFAHLVVCACIGACGSAPVPSSSSSQTPQRDEPAFVARIWRSVDESAAPGTIRIFLPDGTLLMDSCGETYRLVRWRALTGQRIEWHEDGARIEAAIVEATAGALHLRLHLGAETKDERYRLAETPYLCPDLPR